MAKIELKECPFCGGKAKLCYAPNNLYVGVPCFGVYCENCRTMIGTTKNNQTDFYRTPGEAAKAWNRRKTDE